MLAARPGASTPIRGDAHGCRRVVQFVLTVALSRIVGALACLMLVGLLIVTGMQMERTAQLRSELTATRTDLTDARQKLESTMLYIGEMEARRWREREKRKAAR